MATLVSPGVQTSLTIEAFTAPVSASTVPLFFIATRAGKTQLNGVTPAVGTLESGVVRTVTSLQQSLQLYGVPHFRDDGAGNEFHGDARNEYGLFALNQFLNRGNRAYVVRADINLDDSPVTFMSLGVPVVDASSSTYNGIGNGTIGTITATSNQVRPQVITVEITAPAAGSTGAAFTVTGSINGYIGAGNAGVAFTSSIVNLTVTAGSTAFAVGDTFTFTLVNTWTPTGTPTGNGTISNLVADTALVAETTTITFTSATAFSVTGSVSGAAAAGTVGVAYDNGNLNFTVLAGTTAFAASDTFTIVSTSVTLTAPLGATDANRRTAIVTALQAAVNGNTEVRSDLYEFNLLLCPGYPEVVDELLALSTAVMNEAMVIADTPADQTPEQTAQWALTSERFSSENVAYYYPWCLASNVDGRNVLAAPSGTALATITFSDSTGYVWTPPAGVQRGQVVGVSKFGYFTGTPGTATTFNESNLNQGQRDILYEYDKNVNPLVFFPGMGHIVWGQKTSAAAAGAMDRINVVRLVMFLRRALRKGGLPFLFEPNDEITRGNVKAMADSILNDILVKRGLFDYATKCDAENNDGDRIDRNEIYIDVAIKPVKSAEFMYETIRVVNTSAEI